MDKSSEESSIINIRKYQLLNAFKNFCDKLDSDTKEKRIVKSLFLDFENEDQVQALFKNRFNFEIKDDEKKYLYDLVSAYFRKKNERIIINEKTRLTLYKKQNGKCAYCGCKIEINSPVDHIIPFKYVGDELENNYQILCKSCNSKKYESLDYELKLLISKK